MPREYFDQETVEAFFQHWDGSTYVPSVVEGTLTIESDGRQFGRRSWEIAGCHDKDGAEIPEPEDAIELLEDALEEKNIRRGMEDRA